MAIELPPLPYALDALSPYISQETLEYHYGKHHKAYVDKLNAAITGTKFEHLELEDIVKQSSGTIFNNAAQVWNHTFYWHCLSPQGGGEPQGNLMDAINESFGSFETFKKTFSDSTAGHFGSGWAWLVQSSDGKLAVCTTPNAETPLTTDKKPLLTCDVWEHAYYIDTRNDRAQYISHFCSLINWDFVNSNLS